MSEKDYTPGPWVYVQAPTTGKVSRAHIIETRGLDLAFVCQADPFTGETIPAEANARLMAAAPTLLRALTDLIAEIDALDVSMNEWQVDDATVISIDARLERAETAAKEAIREAQGDGGYPPCT